MGSKNRQPMYQDVNGIRLPLGFDPTKLLSCLEYKASAGDIFIDTFPKCGTNWTKRIVQLLVDEHTTKESDYALSTSFFEMVGKDIIAALPEPRIITTHLAYELLPKHVQARYIYVVRNPKDCCVSYFHHSKKTKIYNFEDGTFDEYLQLFIKGATSFGDYFSHLVSWYPHVDEPNVLFLTYESMKKDLASAVLKIAKFIDVKDPELLCVDSKKFQEVVTNCSVDRMKEYLNTNYKKALGNQNPENWTAKKDYPLSRPPPPPEVMVRKGIIGDWKNYFDKDQSQAIETAFVQKCGHVVDHAKLWDPKDWIQEA
ncbi:sulfotransferase ssu-1-like [Dermacentor andersoni]|uniref:sulfotransferase ssu-1-like n=1 Tax=Dermacentor andersoni TaxID=34620 RepID=UPI003B3A7BA2